MERVSTQWQKLVRDEFVLVDDAFLETFRAPGSSNKFVAWNPYERSTRYFRFLLLDTARRQSPRFFEAYRRLRRRDLGAPLTVRCAGCEIDADYLAAVEEWEFLDTAGALQDVRYVVEIGAGFGRTCHALLALAPGITRYVIVDLEPMLRLSQAYLHRVAPGAPVTFVATDDDRALDALAASAPDLVINIDSFQEMPPAVIDGYMSRLVTPGRQFYCKNPVGKYRPAAVGMPDPGEERLNDVFSLGYCREVIDIFDEDVLDLARRRFLEAYRPPAGAAGAPFALAATRPMDLFPYFQHALYRR
jgi:hypothetical protein